MKELQERLLKVQSELKAHTLIDLLDLKREVTAEIHRRLDENKRKTISQDPFNIMDAGDLGMF